MAKKETLSLTAPTLLTFKTVEQMGKTIGIGKNKLCELMDSSKPEYIQNGNRLLIANTAICDWYNQAKTAAMSPAVQGG